MLFVTDDDCCALATGTCKEICQKVCIGYIWRPVEEGVLIISNYCNDGNFISHAK